MEYNYLVTYKARKNKENKEINSTIQIILKWLSKKKYGFKKGI